MEAQKWVVDPTKIDFLRDMQKYSDEPVISTLVGMFLEMTPLALERMRASLTKNELLAVSQEAHKLKANCGNLGLVSMMELFAGMEEAIKKDQPINLIEALEAAEQFLAQSRTYLSELK